MVFSSLKTNTFKNSHSHLEKDKLHQYFKHIHSDDYNDVASNHKQVISDSVSRISNNSAKIKFVEVSEFTDSLSIRWITSSAVSDSNYIKLNSKKSIHIGTTYISVPENNKFINNDLKKVLSIIEFNLVHRSHLKIKDSIGNYIANDIQNCHLFYVSGGEAVNVVSSNFGNSKYQFDSKGASNNSLYVVQHLLNTYGFKKFQKLWENGFSNFDEIYGVTYGKVTREREELALIARENRTVINWKEFNRCI